MPLHLYCLLPTDADAPPAALRGVEGELVRVLRGRAAAAWVSDRESRDATVAAVRAHDAVTGAALTLAPAVLPAHFGAPLGGERDLAGVIDGDAAALRRAFASVEGRVEMSTIIALAKPERSDAGPPPLPPDGGDAPGRDYLEGLRRHFARERETQDAASRLADSVSEAVRGLAERESRAAGDSGSVSLAHLVRRDAVTAYEARVGGVSHAVEWRVVVVGPRATYSFSDLEGILAAARAEDLHG